MTLLVESVKEKQEMEAQPKLQQIRGGKFIDAELDQFKQQMAAFLVPRIQWPSQLCSLLKEDMLTTFHSFSLSFPWK